MLNGFSNGLMQILGTILRSQQLKKGLENKAKPEHKQTGIQTMITKPTLLLDKQKCKRNIAMMFSKAKTNHVSFRPHFKTHQSLEIGRWFKELGVDKITVSSLEMAQYFSTEWNDITVAFPVNILEIDTINQLAEKITLHLLVESVEATIYLAQKTKNTIGIFIKIDVGYHRTGLPPTSTQQIDEILKVISASTTLRFKGFLTHAGHTYSCRTKNEILAIHHTSKEILTGLKARYIDRYPGLIISIGDTPSCSVVDDFSGIDEIRPGNFAFYDLTQQQIGACFFDQIAVAMACPIVAIHPDRNEIVIYGGGVHFAKDRLEVDNAGTIYGIVVEQLEEHWGDPVPGMYLKSLSQEHGIVSVPEQIIAKYKIGDLLYILPVHSCMTANEMKYYKCQDEIISRL
jgi:D-serine deaminase-like pyridoxal phosphate-dependent protein